jgi:integrase
MRTDLDGRDNRRSRSDIPDRNAENRPGLGHVTAHDLRHSLVANALDAGLTLAEASRLARHASPSVTATVYAAVLGSEARLAWREARASGIRRLIP